MQGAVLDKKDAKRTWKVIISYQLAIDQTCTRKKKSTKHIREQPGKPNLTIDYLINSVFQSIFNFSDDSIMDYEEECFFEYTKIDIQVFKD